jgi:hypothetical protein
MPTVSFKRYPELFTVLPGSPPAFSATRYFYFHRGGGIRYFN